MPPTESDCWPAPFLATTPSPACPQLSPGQQAVNQSEDCLYLNVFTTLPTTPVPVLVWIYGGGSVDGSSQSYGPIQNIVPYLNGEVVLVAFNYRLNSFGYLALRELSVIDPRGVSGNYGILDCQQALRWVKHNIAGFGGDPTRVTVFGQSSGGTQILGLLASPASAGLFHAAISLSGSPNITMPLAVMEQQGLQLVQAVGCDHAPSVLDCLYAKTTQELQQGTPQHWSYSGDFRTDTVTPNPPLLPGLVIADGVTVQALPQALSVGLIDVPVIFANMQCETDGEYLDVLTWNTTDFNAFLSKQLQQWPASVVPVLQEVYDPLTLRSAAFAYYNMESDIGTTCGNAAMARIAATSFKSPVYVLVSTHAPSQPVFEEVGSIPQQFPYHTWDAICAFGTWSSLYQRDGAAFTPAASDRQYGSTLRDLWLALARDGHLPASLKAINDTPGFPESYNTVLADVQPSTFTNFKTDACREVYIQGFTEKFWWVN